MEKILKRVLSFQQSVVPFTGHRMVTVMIIIVQYRNIMPADSISQYYASFVFSDIQFEELYLKSEFKPNFVKKYYLINLI